MSRLLIEDRGQNRHIVFEGRHPRHTEWRERSELDTFYSESFLRFLYQVKGDWMLDELDRSEDPLYVKESLYRLLERYRIDVEAKRILDFGCGSGASTIALAELNPDRILGVDVGDDILEVARRRCQERGLSEYAEFQQIRINDPLDFIPDESMDLVFALDVFEHVFPRDRKSVLRTLWRVLKPGGALLAVAPNRLNPYEAHTTSGLWFAYWLPTPLAAAYARHFCPLSRGKSTEQLLMDGLRGYSYFEMRRGLAGTGALDMARVDPAPKPLTTLSGRKRRVLDLGWKLFPYTLRPFGPWEAFQPSLRLCFRKPFLGARRSSPEGTVAQIADIRK